MTPPNDYSRCHSTEAYVCQSCEKRRQIERDSPDVWYPYTEGACMTTKIDYKPCPRSWGDGYTAGYKRAIRDAAEILETVDNHSNPMTAAGCGDYLTGRIVAGRPSTSPIFTGIGGIHRSSRFRSLVSAAHRSAWGQTRMCASGRVEHGVAPVGQ